MSNIQWDERMIAFDVLWQLRIRQCLQRGGKFLLQVFSSFVGYEEIVDCALVRQHVRVVGPYRGILMVLDLGILISIWRGQRMIYLQVADM